MRRQIVTTASRQDENDLTQTRRSRSMGYKPQMFVGSEQLLIGSDSGASRGDVFVQRLQETQSHRGVKVRRGFFSVWSRRRIGIAVIGMTQPRLRREGPAPPASPRECGKKTPQRRR